MVQNIQAGFLCFNTQCFAIANKVFEAFSVSTRTGFMNIFFFCYIFFISLLYIFEQMTGNIYLIMLNLGPNETVNMKTCLCKNLVRSLSVEVLKPKGG